MLEINLDFILMCIGLASLGYVMYCFIFSSKKNNKTASDRRLDALAEHFGIEIKDYPNLGAASVYTHEGSEYSKGLQPIIKNIFEWHVKRNLEVQETQLKLVGDLTDRILLLEKYHGVKLEDKKTEKQYVKITK